MSTASDSNRQTTNRKSRGWIWFFLVLFSLTVAAVGAEIWYNLNQQLRPEQLAAAGRLWREKGPASYQVEYTLKRQDGSEQRYSVTVEGNKVSVFRSGGRPLAAGEYPFARMEELFAYIARQLQADAQPGGPRVFTIAVFDPDDGHIVRYVRSVRSTRERLEVITQLRPLTLPSPPSDGGEGKVSLPQGERVSLTLSRRERRGRQSFRQPLRAGTRAG
ncbi:MAG TPA: hypothetical protein VNK04_07870 [Gemmataceae bacterium]|nr:hypothetical protein [Gemmataceae bacterium]